MNQSVSSVGSEGHANNLFAETPAPATLDQQLHARESVLQQSPEGTRTGANQILDPSAQVRRSKSASVSLHPVESNSTEVDAKTSVQHFCYTTAPWIEAGNTKARFASHVMRLAQDQPAIMSAILTFTSASTERDQAVDGRSFLGWVGFDQGRSRSIDASELAYTVFRGLTTICSFLKCAPRKWESLRPTIITDTEEISRSLDEPLRALAQMHSRLGELSHTLVAATELIDVTDLAIAILSRSAPLTSTSFYRSATSPTTTRMMEPPGMVQHRCLGYLASCLHLIHGNRIPSPDAVGATFSSQWASLWSDSQKWFKTRTLTLQPILDVRSMEASKLDPSHSSAFPIQIYTNVAALQSNIVYHMTCILLLARKPRLLKLTSTEQQFVTSQAWHAQQVAGAAMSNDFAEQWDPIFIVALLHIAKSMTHRAQQQALVSRFHRISVSTGILMDEEIERLQSEWDVVRSGAISRGT